MTIKKTNEGMKHRHMQYLAEKSPWKMGDRSSDLPDPALGGKIFGVVSVSTANLRLHPNHAAELGTQALLGTPLTVLKRRNGWLWVETPEHYKGWTDDRIVLLTRQDYVQWEKQPKIMVTALSETAYDSPNPPQHPVSDIVAGSLLALQSVEASHFEVRYPDGRAAFVQKLDALPLDEWLRSLTPTPEKIIRTACQFTGIPYLWGGTSAKGLDCSGFVKIVYYLNGLLLPRDADQQSMIGLKVDPQPDWSGLAPGDLLFFKSSHSSTLPTKVSHVALSLGGGRFIHADQDIHSNSLNSQDSDFSPSRRNCLVGARRILGAPTGNGIIKIIDLPYFYDHAN